MTDAQREALLAALTGGYFDVPRQTTIGALAATVGISPNAFSERLRRGTSNLVRSALANGHRNVTKTPDYTFSPEDTKRET